MKFESKKDLWISATMLGSATILIGALMLVVVELGQIPIGGDGIVPLLLVCIVIAASLVLGLWIYLGTYYVVLPEHLIARSGPFRYRLKYDDVKSIYPERTMISGPALSMDRLVIERYSKSTPLVVSPVDKEGFLFAVEAYVEEHQRI